MANFNEISGIKQWAAVLGVALVLSVALYFTVFKSQRDANAAAQASLETKLRENAELEAYRPKLAEIDFYTELPFEVELDGPYYSVLNFFDNVGKLERIVNVSGLQVATTKKPTDAKAKHTYQYAPNESVVATCTATTFFSHDLDPAGSAPVKPGQPAPVKKQGSL